MAAARVRCQAATHSPERFGDYVVLGKIASGGMAEVHLACALDGPLAGKPMALKRMLPQLSTQRRFVDMFLSEAVITSRIDHDNVGRIYDYGEVDGSYFIAMEYLHGASLGALLTRLSKRGRRLKLRFATAIFDDVCAGLQAAHDCGVVHRDVSPNNVFITTDGVVKLLDFGVAKAGFVSTNTRTGVVKGTFAYMAPEQLMGRGLDARADVFSLGVVMHEALTCRRLFKRETDYETCRAITREAVPRVCDLRSSVPVALSNAIDRALARRQQDRYASAAELRAALAAAAQDGDRAPSREAFGAEIARIFMDELERIDDLVAEQPTRVALAAPRRPAHVLAQGGRHTAGDIIAALPLRPASAHDAEPIDEAHPTGSVARIDDSEVADVVPSREVAVPPASEVAVARRPAERKGRVARLPALAAIVAAAAVLVLDGGATPGARHRSAAAAVPIEVQHGARAADAQVAAPEVSTPAAESVVAPVLEPVAVPIEVEVQIAAEPVATPPKRSRKRRSPRAGTGRARHEQGPGARIAAEL